MVRIALLAAALAAPASFGPFAWPTSLPVPKDGSVLAVENGASRLVRVTAGHVTTVASGLAKPYQVDVTASGRVYVSTDVGLVTVANGRTTKVPHAAAVRGPFADAVSGAIAYTTETAAVLLDHGKRRVLATRLGGPHGIAFAADGAVLVSDTAHGKVLRLGRGGRATFAKVAEPRGLAVAPDGTVYVVDAAAKRIRVFTRNGVPQGALP